MFVLSGHYRPHYRRFRSVVFHMTESKIKDICSYGISSYIRLILSAHFTQISAGSLFCTVDFGILFRVNKE